MGEGAPITSTETEIVKREESAGTSVHTGHTLREMTVQDIIALAMFGTVIYMTVLEKGVQDPFYSAFLIVVGYVFRGFTSTKPSSRTTTTTTTP